MAGGDGQASSATEAADQQQQSQQQQSSFAYNVYNGSRADNFSPRSRREEQHHWNVRDVFQTGAEHMAAFWDNWNANPAWRTKLISGYIALGNTPSDALDGFKMFKFWDTLGQASGVASESGKKMTPMQILAFMAGKSGALAAQQAKASAQSMVKDVTNTTYTIEDPATALALTQSVLTAALGRQASPDEVKRYTSAIQSYDRANPIIDHIHQDANGNQTKTTTGGVSSTGEQALIANTANNSAEGQAYQTNGVFDQAMKILSGL